MSLALPAAPASAAAADAGPAYVGAVTRALAFALDAGVVNAVAILTTAVVKLILSVVTVPEALRPVGLAVAGAAYVLWVAGYFVTFWATTGQTPGNRVLRIRVCTAAGSPLPPRRAVVRAVALVLAALPLFLGFAPILFDARRRGLHDMLAGSVVIDAERW